MAAVAINRALIVLGFVGLFISGFLSLGTLLRLSLPCGPTKGCDTVAMHPSAWITGNPGTGGITVAYVGFAGYVLLTLLAVWRAAKGQENHRGLVLFGFVVSVIGTLYSGYLTYTSLNVIHATCAWCIASAVTMLATTILYAALLQSDPVPSEVKRGRDVILAGILTVVVAVGLWGGVSYLKGQGASLRGVAQDRINQGKVNLVDADDHILGNPDAPVTIVEFADLLCPTCAQNFPVLEDLVRNSNGRIRMVFHHFPLFMKEDHKMALPAATIAEIASEKDKFWQFLTAIYKVTQADLQSEEVLMEVATSIGLDAEEVRKRLADENDPAIKRVTDDLNLANTLKITGTPTLFIHAKGGEYEQVSSAMLEDKLNQEPYRSLILEGAAGK